MDKITQEELDEMRVKVSKYDELNTEHEKLKTQHNELKDDYIKLCKGHQQSKDEEVDSFDELCKSKFDKNKK